MLAGGDEDADDEGSGVEAEEDDDSIPVEIDQLIDGDLENLEDIDIELPSHQRCAAHILNLLGSKDAKEALEKNSASKKIHEQIHEKLRTIWRRQNKSGLVAEAIQEGLGVKLKIPGETRWNSEYDAKAQVCRSRRLRFKFVA